MLHVPSKNKVVIIITIISVHNGWIRILLNIEDPINYSFKERGGDSWVGIVNIVRLKNAIIAICYRFQKLQ